jgi:peroxiredoxin
MNDQTRIHRGDDMAMTDSHPPVKPGEPAPDFTLPAVDRDGTVSLADYRAKSPVFLALFRGVYCPFCRRAIAQMGTAQEKLRGLGVESLGVVATTAENARLYFKFRPTRLRLAADPELTTHRAYGVPKPEVTAELMHGINSTRINPSGELSEALPVMETVATLERLDGYSETEVDRTDIQRQFPQLTGEFLIDRGGIVRWARIECAEAGMAGLGKFPTEAEILAAARSHLG